MSNITLKQLKYFDALASIGHFGKAAQACSISQPALSMQIKELENSLDADLFERSTKQLRLTKFGEKFQIRTREIIRSVDELGDLARSSKTKLEGPLRIGVIPTIAPYLLPRLIGNLNAEYPTIDIHVRETQTHGLIEELNDGKIDVAILALPILEPAFKEVTLFKEEFVLVRNKKEKNEPIPDAKNLCELRLLLLEEGHCFRDQALAFCSPRLPQKYEGLNGSSLSTLVQMVSAGIGVTLIPEMAINVETNSAEICLAKFKNSKPSRTVGMVWRKTNPLSKQFDQIAKIVKKSRPEVSY